MTFMWTSQIAVKLDRPALRTSDAHFTRLIRNVSALHGTETSLRRLPVVRRRLALNVLKEGVT